MSTRAEEHRVRAFLRCSIDDHPFFVDAASIDAIRPAGALEPDSGPDGLIGFAHHGAARLPVYGLTYLSNRVIETTRSACGTWLLLGGPTPQALWVDEVIGERPVSIDQVLPLPGWVFRRSSRWFSSLARSGEELTPVFWPGRLFTEGSHLPPDEPPPLPDLPAGQGDRITLCAVTAPSPRSRPLTIGLSHRQVVELIEAPRVTRVPGLPTPIEGFFVWRERLVPWLDLAKWLGLESDGNQAGTRLLIVRLPGMPEPFGFPVLPSIRLLASSVEHQQCQRWLPVTLELLRSAVELWEETVLFPDFQKLIINSSPAPTPGKPSHL
jgi:chemotaxis signal transduction protein